MTKIIRGKIENVTVGQNLMGLYAYKLLISYKDDKFIEITDFGYSNSDEWTKKDIGKTGIFGYGWDLIVGRTLKHCKLD